VDKEENNPITFKNWLKVLAVTVVFACPIILMVHTIGLSSEAYDAMLATYWGLASIVSGWICGFYIIAVLSEPKLILVPFMLIGALVTMPLIIAVDFLAGCNLHRVRDRLIEKIKARARASRVSPFRAVPITNGNLSRGMGMDTVPESARHDLAELERIEIQLATKRCAVSGSK